MIAATGGWTVLATVAAMVAAGAALAGLYFAWQTVTQAGETLEAFRTAHREEMEADDCAGSRRCKACSSS